MIVFVGCGNAITLRTLPNMRKVLTLATLVMLGTAACGSNDSSDEAATDTSGASAGSIESGEPVERLQLVVSTSIWGDVAEQAFGELVDVEIVMPAGANPHDFAPSARQAEAMENADLVVVNGAGLEAGMQSVIDAAADAGAPVFEVAEHVDVVEFGEAGDHDHEDHGHEDHGHADDATGTTTADDHADDDRAEGDHADDEQSEDGHEGHDHGPIDPHVWLDPLLVAEAVDSLGHELVDLGVDHDAVHEAADPYIAELESLDAELAEMLSALPEERRVLITNHDAFAYFAGHYGFEVVGTIIESNTTDADTSAAHIEELVEVIDAEGVTAIFAENVESDQLAQSLADETGGEVEVVELLTGSLGEGDAATYVGFMRTNVELIVNALG